MINKIYEKIKQFIQENYLILLFYLVLTVTLTYPLPYYIYTGGGIMNVNSKIYMEEKSEPKGSFNLCYVEELQATIPTYILSYFMPNWEKISKEEVSYDKNETEEEIMIRDKIYLDTANRSAVLTAFKYANKNYEILDNNPIIIYVMKEADTDLKIGDEIISIDGVLVENTDDIVEILANRNIGDKINIHVINKEKEYDRYAVIFEYEDKKLLGVSIENKVTFKTDPIVSFNFSNSESGPSGGLIVSLAIYDYLLEEDITHGLKISGTGTIDENGNVGSIGGVKYKLSGAVKKKSDIFFVPNGENYEEAIKLKKEKDYDIKIVGVSTFEDAIKYLKDNYN